LRQVWGCSGPVMREPPIFVHDSGLARTSVPWCHLERGISQTATTASTAPTAPSPLESSPVIRGLFILLAMLASLTVRAAPFEIKVHDELIAPYNEDAFEIESNLHRRAPTDPLQGTFFQTRLEYARGVTPLSEISINAFTSVYGGRLDLNGGKIAHMYIPTHDESGIFHYGVKNEVNYIRSVAGIDQALYEMTPILAFQVYRWRLTLNPSIDVYFFGNTDRVVLAPSAKLAYQIAAHTSIGMEYYSEVGSAHHPRPFAERPDVAYLTLDRTLQKKINVNLGIGEGLHSASDRWVAKLIVSFALE
jgi:hypothetical protein